MIARLLKRFAACLDRIDGRRWPRLVNWSYLVRPYDDVGDRRSWRWEARTPCQRGGIACRIDSCPECGAAVLALAGGAPVRCCDDHDPRGTVSR